MTDLFISCHAKIQRVDEQLQTLDSDIRLYVESQTNLTIMELHGDPGCYSFKHGDVPEPPLRLGIIVGELTHNLRSALDHLACALFKLRFPDSECAHTQFPICDRETGRGGWVQKSAIQLDELSDNDITTIKGFQPYHRGALAPKHPLAVLRWLSDMDKHRLLHPTWAYFDDVAPDIEITWADGSPNGARADVRYFPGPMKPGTEFLRVCLEPLVPEPDVSAKADIPIGITFSERRYRHSDLVRVGKSVAYIVKEFEARLTR